MDLRPAAFVAILLASTASPAQPRKILAVLELRNTLPQEEKASINMAYFSDMVRTDALEIAPAFQVMTRENVLVILEAAGRKLEDCEGECEVDTGRRLGADLVISGEVYRVAGGAVALTGAILLTVDFVRGHPWLLQEDRE